MKRRLHTLLIFLAEKLAGGPAPKGVEIEGSLRVAGPVEAPDWLPEHRGVLVAFLATDAGKTLVRRGAAVHANTAVIACAGDELRPPNPELMSYNAGRAAGFGDCLRWLLSLSRSSRVPDDSSAETKAQNDTRPTGELELRELMSP